jgi:hypothetical protein
MSLSAQQIPTLSADDFKELTSSINTDTTPWYGSALPGYGAVPNATIGNGGTYSNPGSNGYVYTTTGTTGQWISGGSPATLNVQPSGTIELQGKNPDIKINGKSMVAWMERVEERLNILTPNPELEADWDDLRRLGERYRKLEKKCREKAQMWEALKKVQPPQV